jgi:hypothetical protein
LVFFTVKFGTGFVTVDVHWLDGMHGPVVMVAVFFTLAVSVLDTVAVKVTFTECPAARVTWMVTLAPVTDAVQASVAMIVAHFKVVALIVRFEAIGSLRTAEPAPVPVFFTVMV